VYENLDVAVSVVQVAVTRYVPDVHRLVTDPAAKNGALNEPPL
jgi:hypothetical protein